MCNLDNIYYNTNWEQKLERRLFLLGERLLTLDSKYVRYKQRNTVYFIKCLLIFSHNSSFSYLWSKQTNSRRYHETKSLCVNPCLLI